MFHVRNFYGMTAQDLNCLNIFWQVVELASLAGVESAVGRLQCVNSTIDLIQAQAKEARVTLHQYKDQGEQ